jgi:hypothetical protein
VRREEIAALEASLATLEASPLGRVTKLVDDINLYWPSRHIPAIWERIDAWGHEVATLPRFTQWQMDAYRKERRELREKIRRLR